MCLAYPMRVIEINKNRATVDAEGIKREVNIEFLKNAKIGDYLMVHAGFAIEKFDPKRAKETIGYFKECKDALRKTLKR